MLDLGIYGYTAFFRTDPRVRGIHLRSGSQLAVPQRKNHKEKDAGTFYHHYRYHYLFAVMRFYEKYLFAGGMEEKTLSDDNSNFKITVADI